MSSGRLALASLGGLAVLLGLPSAASGQWHVAAYFGGNYTHPADVVIDAPDRGIVLRVEEVSFRAEPLKAPQYYGYRIGRWVGGGRRWGLEFEFIHLKVIGQTRRTYEMTGRVPDEAVSGRRQMDALVERYSMTHGLNFMLVNLARRQPLSDAVALTLRIGAGGTLPHAETTVGGVSKEQYEYAGPAGHAAVGVDLRLRGRTSLFSEYKFTFAEPQITIAGGTGRTQTATHQAIVGVAFGVSR
jgi:lipid A oxidase